MKRSARQSKEIARPVVTLTHGQRTELRKLLGIRDGAECRTALTNVEGWLSASLHVSEIAKVIPLASDTKAELRPVAFAAKKLANAIALMPKVELEHVSIVRRVSDRPHAVDVEALQSILADIAALWSIYEKRGGKGERSRYIKAERYDMETTAVMLFKRHDRGSADTMSVRERAFIEIMRGIVGL